LRRQLRAPENQTTINKAMQSVRNPLATPEARESIGIGNIFAQLTKLYDDRPTPENKRRLREFSVKYANSFYGKQAAMAVSGNPAE